MDSIVIKIIESFGMPGIIIAIFYFVWNQRLITIIKASEVEKLFFTHEKKFIHRAWLWIGLSLGLFIIIIGTFLVLLNLMERVKFLATIYVAAIIYGLFFLTLIASLFAYFLKDNGKIRNLLEWINAKESGVGTVVAIYIFLTIFPLSYAICYEYINRMPQSNKEIVVLVGALAISVFVPRVLLLILKPWIYKEATYFYFTEGNEIWYLIKPLNDNEFVVGDNFKEDECKKLRFVNFEEIKKKEILIGKKQFSN